MTSKVENHTAKRVIELRAPNIRRKHPVRLASAKPSMTVFNPRLAIT
jgi:hypothetical protein